MYNYYDPSLFISATASQTQDSMQRPIEYWVKNLIKAIASKDSNTFSFVNRLINQQRLSETAKKSSLYQALVGILQATPQANDALKTSLERFLATLPSLPTLTPSFFPQISKPPTVPPTQMGVPFEQPGTPSTQPLPPFPSPTSTPPLPVAPRLMNEPTAPPSLPPQSFPQSVPTSPFPTQFAQPFPPSAPSILSPSPKPQPPISSFPFTPTSSATGPQPQSPSTTLREEMLPFMPPGSNPPPGQPLPPISSFLPSSLPPEAAYLQTPSAPAEPSSTTPPTSIRFQVLDTGEW